MTEQQEGDINGAFRNEDIKSLLDGPSKALQRRKEALQEIERLEAKERDEGPLSDHEELLLDMNLRTLVHFRFYKRLKEFTKSNGIHLTLGG